jgi:hypothetical protein
MHPSLVIGGGGDHGEGTLKSTLAQPGRAAVNASRRTLPLGLAVRCENAADG